jgi:hypothetical protein
MNMCSPEITTGKRDIAENTNSLYTFFCQDKTFYEQTTSLPENPFKDIQQSSLIIPNSSGCIKKPALLFPSKNSWQSPFFSIRTMTLSYYYKQDDARILLC